MPREGAEGEPGAQKRSQRGSLSTHEESNLWMVSIYWVMQKYRDFHKRILG